MLLQDDSDDEKEKDDGRHEDGCGHKLVETPSTSTSPSSSPGQSNKNAKVVESSTVECDDEDDMMILNFSTTKRQKSLKMVAGLSHGMSGLTSILADGGAAQIELSQSTRKPRTKTMLLSSSNVGVKRARVERFTSVPQELPLMRIKEEMMELHLGRKRESDVKVARNVGPKMIPESERLRKELLELALGVCGSSSQELHWMLRIGVSGPKYSHPLLIGSNSTLNVLNTTGTNRNAIWRRIRALMQRQLSQPPLYAIPSGLPEGSHRDLESLISFCFASNSAANPLHKQRPTESKYLQCKRIRSGYVQRSQSAAIVTTEMASALIRKELHSPGPLPFSDKSFDPCDVFCLLASHNHHTKRLAVVTSTSLHCVSMPCKLCPYSLLDEARRLATMEDSAHVLSSNLRCDVLMMREVCQSVLDLPGAKHNVFWASVALISICLSHPYTRMDIQLDALSIHYVQTLSIYACKEQTRRNNYANDLLKRIQTTNKETDMVIKELERERASERLCSQQIRDDRRKGLGVNEALIGQHTIAQQRVMALQDRLAKLDDDVQSARNVRRKNGLTEHEEPSEELRMSRANLGSSPKEVIASWINILNGDFMHVMNTLSTEVNDAELSTVTNVQIQLAKTERDFEDMERQIASSNQESHLTDLMWELVLRVVKLMNTVMKITSMAPKLTPEGAWVRVDEGGSPPRVLFHEAQLIDASVKPPETSQHTILWTNDCMVLPERFEVDNTNTRSDSKQFQALMCEYVRKRKSARSDARMARLSTHHPEWRGLASTLLRHFPEVKLKGATAPSRSILVFKTTLQVDPKVMALVSTIASSPKSQTFDGTQSHAPTGCVPPASLGLRAQWIAFSHNTRRRSNPLRLQFGASLTTTSEVNPSCEREQCIPSPLATICEFQAKVLPSPTTISSQLKTFSVAYTVCASHATRVVDYVRDEDTLRDGLAMLAAGLVHAGSISQIGSMCTADDMITLMNNGQRIQQRADNSTMLNLTVFNLYIAGRANIIRNMINTAWEGVYPSWLDSSVTPLGMDARNKSDDRNPGSFYMSAETSTKYARAFTKEWLVQTTNKHCDVRPHPTQGIPHAIIPGVHTALDPYYEALQRAHHHLKLPSHEQCEVLVFPVSPYAQQLGSVLPSPEWSVDSLPHDVGEYCRGRTINPDNTDPRLAIAYSQCIQPPMQLYPGDNLLENGLEEIGSFLALASYLATLSMWCGRIVVATTSKMPSSSECVDILHNTICAYVGRKGATSRTWNSVQTTTTTKTLSCNVGSMVSIRALLVLNAMYPSSHAIGEPLFHPIFELNAYSLLNDPQHKKNLQLQEWWQVFTATDSTKCAWQQGVRPFLCELIEQQNSHAQVEPNANGVLRLREAFHNAVCASYYVYSQNGTIAIPESNPLHQVTAPNQIQRHHVDGSFVVRSGQMQCKGVCIEDTTTTKKTRVACGGVVGLKFFQMQQFFLLLEATGRSTPPKFQLYRCGGPMLIRQSSDSSEAPLPTGSSRKESNKQKRYLCALFEKDIESQGTIRERRDVCCRCRIAWDHNLLTFLNIFNSINKPRKLTERMQGDALKTFEIKLEDELWQSEGAYATAMDRFASLVVANKGD